MTIHHCFLTLRSRLGTSALIALFVPSLFACAPKTVKKKAVDKDAETDSESSDTSDQDDSSSESDESSSGESESSEPDSDDDLSSESEDTSSETESESDDDQESGDNDSSESGEDSSSSDSSEPKKPNDRDCEKIAWGNGRSLVEGEIIARTDARGFVDADGDNEIEMKETEADMCQLHLSGRKCGFLNYGDTG